MSHRIRRRLGRFPILLIVFALAAVLSACTPVQETAPQTGTTPAPEAITEPTAASTPSLYPLEVTDDLGRTLTLAQRPERISSLSAGHTEIFFALGAGEQVVAVDRFSNYPPQAQERAQIDAFQLNPEAVAAVEPDLVLLTYDPGGVVEALERLEIPTFFVKAPSSVEGVMEAIRMLGRLTGHPQKAEEVVADMRARIQAVQEAVQDAGPGPRVFHELDSSLFTVGPRSFIGDIYTILGAQNIVEDVEEEYLRLSQEVIIERDPEVIVLADESAGESPETVAARPGWATISAVRNGRVHAVDPDLVSRPGPRVVEALETLAKLLYPDEFPG